VSQNLLHFPAKIAERVLKKQVLPLPLRVAQESVRMTITDEAALI
jgi:hypothetical protein